MSAKLLNSLPDDHRDLHKQIGCINGLFQHFLGGRRVIGQNHKRLPPGPDNGSHGMEPKSASEKKTAKNVKKSLKEKKRASTEASRTSSSSTSSSSSGHTSADCNKTPQTPRPSLTQTNFPETPTRNFSSYRSNVTLPLSKSLDLRDVVKDSIRRETRGLSVKTTTKHESGQQTLKYIDSPRPLQSPRSAKTRGPAHNESLRVLAKLQEAPRTSSERKDSSLAFTPRDAPRFSYDERVSQDTINIKLKELPRLSLDSKLHRRNVNSNDMENQHQEPGSYRGPSSIVAKLMGLDSSNSMPTGNQSWDIKTCSDGKEKLPGTDDSKQNLISSSPRKPSKESISLHLRRVDSAKTPIISSKCPIEPAPWKHPDLSKGQKPPSKCKETPLKVPNSSVTVYGEIERRLAQLEFKNSGKDLRALKQILEAMQKSKQTLESRTEDQASNFVSQERIDSYLDQSSKFANFSNLETNTTSSATNKGTTSPRKSRTTVVIMKPAKFVERASSPTSSVSTTDSTSRLRTRDSSNPRREKVGVKSAKELTPRHNYLRDPCSQLHPTEKNNVRSPRLLQASKVPSCTNREIQRPGMSSDSISLKLQQKKHEMEEHSCCTASRSEQSRRQQSRQQTESCTPYLKPQHKSPSLRQYDDQLNGVSSYLRDLSHQEDASSVQSETNTSLVSTSDNEVTSTDKSSKISSTLFQQQKEKWNNPAARLLEEGSTAEPIKVALEQPSPVSVLDATFYGDESPSPVKKISNAFKDDGCLNREEVEWSSRNSNSKDLPDGQSSSHEHYYGKVENIQHLVQKAMDVESTYEESITREILPINNGTNPDHKYISEILLASDILTELESGFTRFQFYPSGKPINPSLFLVLEETKTSTRLSNHKRNGQRINLTEAIQREHRKVIFDAVNELLASKLLKEGSCEQWLSSNKLADRRLGGQQLLRDLCREIDCLNASSYCSLDDEDDTLKGILWEDLKHQSAEWTVFQNELPWVVLDLERLIFKDLITEVVGSVAANLRERPSRHCRQLFPS